MAKVYADLIKKGLKTLDDVPAQLRMMWRLCLRRTAMCKLRELLLYILLRKEVECMAVVYATLIVKGLKTIEQVPSLIKSQVEEILVALEVEV